jgi:putative phosphonate transport system ATP-binding protein
MLRVAPLAKPLLQVKHLSKQFGQTLALQNIQLDIDAGEIIAIVGESGSGKTTLLKTIAGLTEANQGEVLYQSQHFGEINILQAREFERRLLNRTEWGFVHQHARDGLRMNVSAGANIGERLMSLGERHYGRIREQARHWLEMVEIDPQRIDDLPHTFSGGMQQRLQIARNLVTKPQFMMMDEPTSGLDVSVQAKLLDLLKKLSESLGLAVLIVTHDLAVARLLADQMIVMQQGRIVESGLTDQVLDDPQHPYTQLLVSSVIGV